MHEFELLDHPVLSIPDALTKAKQLMTQVEESLDGEQRIYQPLLDDYRQALSISARHDFGEIGKGIVVVVGSLMIAEDSQNPFTKNLSRAAAIGALIYTGVNLWVGMTKSAWKNQLADRDSYAEGDFDYLEE